MIDRYALRSQPRRYILTMLSLQSPDLQPGDTILKARKRPPLPTHQPTLAAELTSCNILIPPTSPSRSLTSKAIFSIPLSFPDAPSAGMPSFRHTSGSGGKSHHIFLPTMLADQE